MNLVLAARIDRGQQAILHCDLAPFSVYQCVDKFVYKLPKPHQYWLCSLRQKINHSWAVFDKKIPISPLKPYFRGLDVLGLGIA